jgi:hypothetical protein
VIARRRRLAPVATRVGWIVLTAADAVRSVRAAQTPARTDALVGGGL